MGRSDAAITMGMDVPAPRLAASASALVLTAQQGQPQQQPAQQQPAQPQQTQPQQQAQPQQTQQAQPQQQQAQPTIHQAQVMANPQNAGGGAQIQPIVPSGAPPAVVDPLAGIIHNVVRGVVSGIVGRVVDEVRSRPYEAWKGSSGSCWDNYASRYPLEQEEWWAEMSRDADKYAYNDYQDKFTSPTGGIYQMRDPDAELIWGGELESFLRREAYRGRGSLASAEGYSPYRWQGLLRRRGEGQGAWLERECQHNLANFAKRPNTAYVGLSDSVREAKGEGFAREVELARRDHHVLVYGDYRNRLVLRGLLRGGHELSSDYKAQMRSAVYARFLQAHARGRFLGELLGAAQSMVQEDDPATRVPEIPYKFYTDSYGNNMREVQMDPSVWALHHQDFEMRREVVALCQEIWPTYQVPSTLDDLEPGLDIAGLIAEEPGDDEVRAGIKRLAREFPNQTDDSELPEGIMQRKGARDWVLQHRMPAPLGGREWPDGTGIGIELQEWVCLMIHARRSRRQRFNDFLRAERSFKDREDMHDHCNDETQKNKEEKGVVDHAMCMVLSHALGATTSAHATVI